MVKENWEKPIASDDPIDIFNIKLKRFKKKFKGGAPTYLVTIGREKMN